MLNSADNPTLWRPHEERQLTGFHCTSHCTTWTAGLGGPVGSAPELTFTSIGRKSPPHRAGTAGSEGPWRSNAPGLPDEVWFGIIERQAVRRGSFPSVRDLMIKIRGFIDGWNRRKHPFIWTKPADDILARIDRRRKHIMKTGHSSGHR